MTQPHADSDTQFARFAALVDSADYEPLDEPDTAEAFRHANRAAGLRPGPNEDRMLDYLARVPPAKATELLVEFYHNEYGT